MDQGEELAEIWDKIFRISKRRKIAYDLRSLLFDIGSTFTKASLDNGNDLR
jgi:hypothetical protein